MHVHSWRIQSRAHTLRQAALKVALDQSMSISCEKLLMVTQLLPIGCMLGQNQRPYGFEFKVPLLYELYVI